MILSRFIILFVNLYMHIVIAVPMATCTLYYYVDHGATQGSRLIRTAAAGPAIVKVLCSCYYVIMCYASHAPQLYNFYFVGSAYSMMTHPHS